MIQEQQQQPMQAFQRPVHTWEGPLREGHHELLCDYDEANVSGDWYGNISNFVRAITPSLPITPHPGHTAATSRCCYPLHLLWKEFDNPFGVEIPVQGAQMSWLRHNESLFYMPLLSGFSFVHAESGERYEHFVTAPPTDRAPLTQYMQNLISTKPFEKLASAHSCDFTFGSWYSVLWNPIHCQHHSPQRSAGIFLSYHLINPLRCSDTNPAISTNVASVLDVPSDILRQEVECHNTNRPTMFSSLLGILPYRVRSDVWYRWLGSGLYCAPLQLVKNCNALIMYELKRPGWAGHHDFEHYVKYDRSLSNFLDNPFLT
jgi:hypothetical protein